MTTSKTYFSRPNHRFLSGERSDHSPTIAFESAAFEFNESEIFYSPRSNSPDQFLKPATSIRISKNPSAKRAEASAGGRKVSTASSLPVNIPDWSKILREEYREHQRHDNFEDDDFDGGVRVPPHEFLVRTRIASLSVHEGIGRTLKGRDLSQVRNAIWEKTGFED